MSDNEPSNEKRIATTQTVLCLKGIDREDVDEQLLKLIHEHFKQRGLLVRDISVHAQRRYASGRSWHETP
ncbi:hypothetical protein [Haladaptatus sp.]|uniref:hypothetical protein n=1 Tax=Haladaptatus sp. TaxID=1973141 RepID=UPI003C5553DE